MMLLPERNYFTLQDLAIRWDVDESDIQYLIETDELAKADLYAAIRGKRQTLFIAEEQKLTPEEKAFILNLQEHTIIQLPAGDDIEIIRVAMPDISVPHWDKVMQEARNKYPDTSIMVVLLKDVKNYESKHNQLETLKEVLGRRDKQVQAILGFISEYEFNPQEIPDGGKAKIRVACDKITGGLFTKNGFIRAWQEGLDRGLFRMKNHDKFKS